jgi:hypothetical protein
MKKDNRLSRSIAQEIITESIGLNFTLIDKHYRILEAWDFHGCKIDTSSHGRHEILDVRNPLVADAILTGLENTTIAENHKSAIRLRKKIASRDKAKQNRKDRDAVMESFGLTKVRGSVSGKTYWE